MLLGIRSLAVALQLEIYWGIYKYLITKCPFSIIASSHIFRHATLGAQTTHQRKRTQQNTGHIGTSRSTHYTL